MQRRHITITTSLLMLIIGTCAAGEDKGFLDCYDTQNLKGKKLHPHTALANRIFQTPYRASHNLDSCFIDWGKKAIKSDRLPMYKRIVGDTNFIWESLLNQNISEVLFETIVKNWSHLRNPKAYLVRLEKNTARLPDLTKEMLIKQFNNAFSSNYAHQDERNISKCTAFLILAKDMKITGKSCSPLEYMQHKVQKRTNELLKEETIAPRMKKIISYLYTSLQIEENPFTINEMQP
jgi:hypothetical protein